MRQLSLFGNATAFRLASCALVKEGESMTRQFTWHNDPIHHPDEWFCSTEQIWKPKGEFSLRDSQRGLPQWDCDECRKKRMRNRYSKNKERVQNINRVAKLNSREENREYVYDYLCKHPCADCGNTNPQLLTFDHIRGVKRLNISDMVNKAWSIESIQAEIAKCDVVCFNCHMIREHNRRNARKTR